MKARAFFLLCRKGGTWDGEVLFLLTNRLFLHDLSFLVHNISKVNHIVRLFL